MPKTKANSASQKALKLIKKEHLTPRPLWQFRLLSGALWLIVGLSFVLGGLALAVGLFMLRTNDWDLAYIPAFWLTILFIFWLLSPKLLASTRYGYRLTSRQFLLLNLTFSLVISFILIQTRIPMVLDTFFQQKSVLYSQLTPHKQDFWSQPQEGRLSGTIGFIDHSSFFRLTDWTGIVWDVNLTSQSTIRRRVRLIPGEKVKIIGKMTGKTIFEASDIRPWQGLGERNNPGPLY